MKFVELEEQRKEAAQKSRHLFEYQVDDAFCDRLKKANLAISLKVNCYRDWEDSKELDISHCTSLKFLSTGNVTFVKLPNSLRILDVGSYLQAGYETLFEQCSQLEHIEALCVNNYVTDEEGMQAVESQLSHSWFKSVQRLHVCFVNCLSRLMNGYKHVPAIVSIDDDFDMFTLDRETIMALGGEVITFRDGTLFLNGLSSLKFADHALKQLRAGSLPPNYHEWKDGVRTALLASHIALAKSELHNSKELLQIDPFFLHRPIFGRINDAAKLAYDVLAFKESERDYRQSKKRQEKEQTRLDALANGATLRDMLDMASRMGKFLGADSEQTPVAQAALAERLLNILHNYQTELRAGDTDALQESMEECYFVRGRNSGVNVEDALDSDSAAQRDTEMS